MVKVDSLLLTGGSGFVGQSFLDYLAELNVDQLPKKIALTTRSHPIQVPDELKRKTEVIDIYCDLHKTWDFKFQATHVIHLAADGSEMAYTEKSGRDFLEIVKNLTNWCHGQDHPTVFHASSGAVYGQIKEDGNVMSPSESLRDSASIASFSENKKHFVAYRLAAEEILYKACSDGNLNLRIGRLFSFIGKHLKHKPQYVINVFENMAKTNGEIRIAGNPQSVRGYLGTYDMSNWIYRALVQDLQVGIFDIGSSDPVSMIQLATFIAAKYNAGVVLLQPDAKVDYYLANNQKTLNDLEVVETESWMALLSNYLD